MTNLLESMEHVEESDHGGSISPPNGHLHTPGMMIPSHQGHPPYYSFQQGLPTPPNGFPDQAGCWPQYHAYPQAGAMMTPDQSPDPPAVYGLHGSRPQSIDSNYGFPGQDSRRFRSATPVSVRTMEGYTRHSSAGPRIDGPSGGEYVSGAHLSGPDSAGPSGSPAAINSFQAQLNMVNSLNAKIEHDALVHHQPYINESAHHSSRPAQYVTEGISPHEQTPSSHHALPNTMLQAHPHSYQNASGGYVDQNPGMPPPSRPASSYNRHPASQSIDEVHSFQTPGTVTF